MGRPRTRFGTKVRVSQGYRIAGQRGLVGRVVGCYGVEGYLAVDVRFDDGRCRLFWPDDLEEISAPGPSWWRFFNGGKKAS